MYLSLSLSLSYSRAVHTSPLSISLFTFLSLSYSRAMYISLSLSCPVSLKANSSVLPQARGHDDVLELPCGAPDVCDQSSRLQPLAARPPGHDKDLGDGRGEWLL